MANENSILNMNSEFNLAQNFIKSYIASKNGLKEMNVIRSEKDVKGDYAEWIVSKFLNLTLATSSIQRGYDAKDESGKTYQIKSRIWKTHTQTRTTFDFTHSVEGEFDYLIGVLFTYELEVIAIVKTDVLTAKKNIKKHNDHDYRFVLNKARFTNSEVEILYWNSEIRTLLNSNE